MANILVRFSKEGFYHPAYGVLGHSDGDRGRVYSLPEFFAADGMLPASAEIINASAHAAAVEDDAEEAPIRPKAVSREELERAKARASKSAAPKRRTQAKE